MTAGQRAAAERCASSCTVAGVTYGYKSSSKTAGTLGRRPDRVHRHRHRQGLGRDHRPVLGGRRRHGAHGDRARRRDNHDERPGWLRKSGAYNVYANATDAASGILTVKANVSTITSGQTALALSACTTGCTIGGVTYAYKSANKTASSVAGRGRRELQRHGDRQRQQRGHDHRRRDGRQHRPDRLGGRDRDRRDQRAGLRRARAATTSSTATRATGPAGSGSVTAKASNLTTGQTALVMPACVASCSAGGVAHGFTSAAIDGQRLAERRLQDLHAHSDRQRREHDDDGEPAGHRRQHRADRRDHVPDGRVRGRLGRGLLRRQAWPTSAAPQLTPPPASPRCRSASGSRRLRASTGTRGPRRSRRRPRCSRTRRLTLPSWSFPMAAGAFTNATGYTLRALVTDSAGNTATTSTTFTFLP